MSINIRFRPCITLRKMGYALMITSLFSIIFMQSIYNDTNIFAYVHSINDVYFTTSNGSFNRSAYSKGKITFPEDEGYKGTKNEWWYLTSHFFTKTGENYTYTIAYVIDQSIKNDDNGSMQCYRYVSITEESTKRYFGQFLIGNFTSEEDLLNLTYMNSNGDQDYWREETLFEYTLYTEVSGIYALNVSLSANKYPLINGNEGIIPMGYGGDSYYYSLTNLSLNGTFRHEGIIEEVSGIAWIDRQWGNWEVSGYDGWEWFALQLSDNTEIMLFIFFDPETKERIPGGSIGSIIFNNGSSRYLSDEEFLLQNLDYWTLEYQYIFIKKCFSSGWRLTIPEYNIDLTIIPTSKNQVTWGIWEGSCYLNGTHNNVTIEGIGTVELTHYYYIIDYLRLTVMSIFLLLALLGIFIFTLKTKRRRECATV